MTEAARIAASTAFTFGLYFACGLVQRRLRWAFLHPLILSAIVGGILFALLPPQWLDAYLASSWPIGWLLGPATAALALPFFRQRAFLVAHARTVLLGVFTGCTTTVAVVWALGKGLGLPAPLLSAASLKSVTLPVALGLAQLVHTHPGITTVCVFTTGIVGSAIGPPLLTRVGVRSPIARGLVLGTLSHGIGTARALDEHPVSGAGGVVALTLSALLVGAAAIAYTLLAP